MAKTKTEEKIDTEKETLKTCGEASCEHSHHRRSDRPGQIFGLIVLIIGVLFLLQNFFPYLGFGKLWPLILVFFGILIITAAKKD